MAREAARIFLSLRDNPKDKEAQRAQNSFVSRGPEARAAYDRVATAWTASREKARPKGGGALALFLALSLAGYFSYDSLRIRLLADFTTSSAVSGFALTSGDRVILDAGSALADKTDEGLRVVELLQGSGFFDVNSSDFPFVVSAEDVSVEVKGTAFEVS
ncbi:MAG: FecR domain-containing protein, partial [Pseudomonadota bacterium]